MVTGVVMTKADVALQIRAWKAEPPLYGALH